MLLVGTYRLHQIIHEKYALNREMLDISAELRSLQSYASSIADGVVSASEFTSLSSSQIDRAARFNNFTNDYASSEVSNEFGLMKSMGVIQQQNDATLQQQYEQYIYSQMMEQARKEAADVESRLLEQKELDLQERKADLEVQIEMLKAEEESIKEAVKESAKDTAPVFA